MKIMVCDLCKKNLPDVKISYKYRAKRFWSSDYGGFGWEKIDICPDCLDEIIDARKSKQKEVNKEEEVNSDRTFLYTAWTLKDTVAADKEGKMQIVIELSEEIYRSIIEHYDTFPVEMKKYGVEAIKNGTPLPEGHADKEKSDAASD